MRVLIVGCGYVGLPLGAELARQGHQVFGIRRNPKALDELKAAHIQPISADITRAEHLERLPLPFDWVVNCVASGGGGAEEYRRLYLQGTQNLIERFAAAPPQKFVYTSSTSVYGQIDGSVVDETSPTTPAVPTAKVLLKTEEALLVAARQKTFPAVILRLAGIYGPDRGYWFKQFLAGEARMEGDGKRFLNMIHLDDVVGCVIATLQGGRAGEIYNAVDDEPVSQCDFFQWLATTLASPMPPSVALEPDAARKRGVTNKRVANGKLKAELKYQFQYPDFRRGYAAEIRKSSTSRSTKGL